VAERDFEIWPHVDKYVKTVTMEGKAPTTFFFYSQFYNLHVMS